VIEYFGCERGRTREKARYHRRYYDQDLEINGASVLGALAPGRRSMHKKISRPQRTRRDIYSFEMVFGPAKGEETSKPKLIHGNKSNPITKAQNPDKLSIIFPKTNIYSNVRQTEAEVLSTFSENH